MNIWAYTQNKAIFIFKLVTMGNMEPSQLNGKSSARTALLSTQLAKEEKKACNKSAAQCW